MLDLLKFVNDDCLDSYHSESEPIFLFDETVMCAALLACV